MTAVSSVVVNSLFLLLQRVSVRASPFTKLISSFIAVFMPPKKLLEAYSNRTVRPSVPLPVRCISSIFFEVGIPKLVFGCILGLRSGSVAYHFWVTVTLTSDLVFIVITMSVRPTVRPSTFVSGAYLLYSLR